MTDHDDADKLRDALDEIARRSGHTSLHYDRNGHPITIGEWGVLWSDKSYQILQQTWARDGAWVSTVWLGIDHGFSDSAPPIIFETMVWHDGGDTTQERYATEADARTGHAAIVEQHGGADPHPPERPQSPRIDFQRLEFDSEDDDD